MLPEILSNGLCSLNPNVDRLCMACEMTVDAKGEVSGARFHNAVMRSHARLTYEQVARMLVNAEEADRYGRRELLPQLQNLQAVFHALFAARQKRGAIDFESEETRILFGADRKIEAIEPVERNEAHRIIEECMIAANVQASLFLEKHRMATLYRVHSGPEADRLAALREFLAGLGLSLGGGEKPEPRHYAKLLDAIKTRPDARLVQTVMLRSLAQAVYSPDTPGHFGLALESYAHFTSPIRRYPDLVVHRGLKHLLAGQKRDGFGYGAQEMRELGVHCSMTERRADEATRDAVNWLKCEYMQEHLGATFDGIVTGVVPFGLFLMLDRVYVEGLVHVSSLPGDYWHHDVKGHCLRGERSGRVWRLGDRMRVKVARVNLDERKIDFEPVLSKPQAQRGAGARTHKRNRRKR
jgi:ribonuclease R